MMIDASYRKLDDGRAGSVRKKTAMNMCPP